MGSKDGSIPVGYRYSAGMHMLLCHGPVDAVRRIIVGERVAWSDTVTAGARISINQPELFGGDAREGGIVGDVDIAFGEATQPRNDYLQSVLGMTNIPAFRGLLGLVLRRVQVSAINPYVKPWKVEATRYAAPGWYDAKRAINTLDANAAHILRECITNAEWGMGYGTYTLDDASFTACADTLHAEGAGISLLWEQQQPIKDFMRLVAQHVDAVVYDDPGTGLITMRLIRGGYDVNTLPRLTDDDLIALEAFERTTDGDVINSVTVRWVNRDGKAQASTVHDLAGQAMTGSVNGATIDLPGIPTAEQANAAAMRYLAQASRPATTMTGVYRRTASFLRVGDAVRVTCADAGLTVAVMRVTGINFGTFTDSRVRVSMIEDAFGLPSPAINAGQTSLWTSPYGAPEPALFRMAMEAPWWTVVREITGESATLQSEIDPEGGVLMVGAGGLPGASLGYQIWTRQGTAAYTSVGSGEVTPTSTLAFPTSKTSTSFTLAGSSRLASVAVGTWAVIDPGGTAEEIVLVKAVTLATETITVARGVLDTVPQAHAGGVRIYFIDGDRYTGKSQYLAGETVQIKTCPKTTQGALLPADAPVDSYTFIGRAGRPYPPGNLRLDGSSYPSTVTGDLSITWAHRDRTLQTAYIVEQGEGNIGPEAGTTYTVRIYAAQTGGTLLRTYTGLTGTAQTYTAAQAATDNGGSTPSNVRVEIEAVRGGKTSLWANTAAAEWA